MKIYKTKGNPIEEVGLKEVVIQESLMGLKDYMNLQRAVIDNMQHKEWLESFTEEQIKGFLDNGSIIWMYYSDEQAVCSIMYFPATEKSLEKLDSSDLDYKTVADLGPTMVHPDYVGNGLQGQMTGFFEEYVKSIGCNHILSTVHPDNLYSLNNLLKLNYKIIGEKELKRGRRAILRKDI